MVSKQFPLTWDLPPSMQIEQQRASRRRMLLCGMAGLCSLMPIASFSSGTFNESVGMNLTHLINALRLIGKPVCSNAADRLETDSDVTAGFDLHLRHAELTEADARVLATGLLRSADALILKSFSASFNPNLADKGTEALIEAFPESMTELGLVGCSIGDAGGRAIVKWAQTAPQLRMICVEGNQFSDGMKLQLNELANQGRRMLVVV